MLAVLDRVERMSLTAPAQNRPGTLRISTFSDGLSTAFGNKGKLTFGMDMVEEALSSDLREMEPPPSGDYRFLFGVSMMASAPLPSSQHDHARVETVTEGDDTSIILDSDPTAGPSGFDWDLPPSSGLTTSKKSSDVSSVSGSTASNLSSSARVICLDTSDTLIYGAHWRNWKVLHHAGGKLLSEGAWALKSFLSMLKEDGIQQALFITVPQASQKLGSTQTAAFQEPFLDAATLSPAKHTKMMTLSKPIPMWASKFAMIKEETKAMGKEASFPTTIAQMQHKAVMVAIMPAKQSQPDKVQVAFPPPLLLRVLAEGSNKREAISILVVNQNILAQQCRTYAEELIHQMSQNAELTPVISGIADKVNVLSRLVGVPPLDVQAPSLWQVIESMTED